MRNFVVILLCLFCCDAFASKSFLGQKVLANGNWIGNGGVAVSCSGQSANEKSQWALLDLVEITPEAFTADFPEGDVMEQVYALIDRVQPLAPDRARLYKELAGYFERRIRYEENLPLTTDIDSADIPDDCVKAQAVVQYRNSMRPDFNVYYVDPNYWAKLDTHQKAVFILHEIFYYEAATLGTENDSTPVRKYVRAVVGNTVGSMTALDYKVFMVSIGLGIEYWQDPETGKNWALVTPYGKHIFNTEICQFLVGGKLPSPSEFLEVAPRLFAAPEAQRLSLLNENLSFWVRDEAGFELTTYDRFGKEMIFIPGQERLYSQVCLL